MHHEDINFETDELRCQIREPFLPPLGMALDDDDVLSFDLPVSAESTPRSLAPALVEFRRIRRQKADPPNLPGLLPLTSDRRRENAPTDDGDERSSVHYWMISSARVRID